MTTRLIITALLASLLTGCFVETRPRPCHTDCWWEHGRRICERRCR
jgi:entry exclusion lipoprotein TrbK